MNKHLYSLVTNLYRTMIVLILPLVISSPFAHSQTTSVVSEGKYPLESVLRNGYDAPIEGDTKEILKKLRKDFKAKYAIKLSSKGNQLSASEKLNTSLSDKHFSIYIELLESSGEQRLRLWMSFGTDVYVNSTNYQRESDNVTSYLKGFIVDYCNSYYVEMIDQKERDLKKTTKSLNKLNGSKAKLIKTESKYAAKTDRSKEKQALLGEKLKQLQEEIAAEELREKEYLTEVEKNSLELKEEIQKIETLESQRSIEAEEIKNYRRKMGKLNTQR